VIIYKQNKLLFIKNVTVMSSAVT